MEAVIETGGKQYRVTPGMRLEVERIPATKKEGKITFDRVLLFVSDNGRVVTDPKKLSEIKVKARLISERKGKKILVFKKKAKTDYKKSYGHRQIRSLVEIEEIVAKKVA